MASETKFGFKTTENGLPAIRFERNLNHVPEKVWFAITNSEQLSKWFPADLVGERKQSASIQIVSFTQRFPPVKGLFTAFEPYRLLEYTWDDEILRWEIQQNPTGCELIFTNVLDKNAEIIGIADIATAWHSCLDVLEFILNEQTPPYTTDERFLQIHSDYLKLMNANP